MPILLRRQPGYRCRRRSVSGFTLIEVLVAVVVLAIGILGVAAMQTTSMTQGHGSLQASQAIALAYDMADRLRANSTDAYTGKYEIDTLSSGTYSTSGVKTCWSADASTPTACTSADDMAAWDLATWYNLVQTQLPGARVKIYCSDNNKCGTGPNPETIQISIYWNQNVNNSKAANAKVLKYVNCGTTAYDPTSDYPCVFLALQP